MNRFSTEFDSGRVYEEHTLDTSTTSMHSSASSSKAVLAALRALQEKIRRLEAEKTQALDECQMLRSQKKAVEMDIEHERQKELVAKQKHDQDTRLGLDKLLSEKSELEHKLDILEDRRNSAMHNSEEMMLKIQALEEDKSSALTKLNELETLQRNLEKQFLGAQEREQEIMKTLNWETTKHSEEVNVINSKLVAAQKELERVKAEKVGNDKRVVELDHLVGQLLSINEALVRQIGGDKGAKFRQARSATGVAGSIMKPTESSKGKQVKIKKTTMQILESGLCTEPLVLTELLTSSTQKKIGLKQSLSDNVVANAQQLQSLHDIYVNMARSSVKNPTTTAGGAKKTKKAKKVSTRMNSRRPPLPPTSTERAYSILNERMKGLNVSLPSAPSKATIFDDSSDGDSSVVSNTEFQNALAGGVSFSLINSEPQPKSSPARGSPYNTKGVATTRDERLNTSGVSTASSKHDLKSAISTLEKEFDSLNEHYRRLLSSDVPQGNEGTEELVDVIQRMHAKGEELRCLKSPERSPSVPKSLRSPEHSRSPSLSDKRSPPGSSGSGSGQPSKLYEGIRINSSASSTRAASASTHISQLSASPAVRSEASRLQHYEQATHHPDHLSSSQIEQIKHKLLAASYTIYGTDVRALFDRMDVDGSGQVDKKELTAAVRRLLPDISKAQINSLMKLVDEDQNGKLDYPEFIRFLGHRDSETSHYAYRS